MGGAQGCICVCEYINITAATEYIFWAKMGVSVGSVIWEAFPLLNVTHKSILPFHTPPRCPSDKSSAPGAADPGFDSCLHSDFSGYGSIIPVALKTDTSMATLPGARRCRVSAGVLCHHHRHYHGICWPGVSIL